MHLETEVRIHNSLLVLIVVPCGPRKKHYKVESGIKSQFRVGDVRKYTGRVLYYLRAEHEPGAA